MARIEPNSCVIDAGPGIREQVQCSSVTAKLDAYFLQYPVSLGLDGDKRFFVEQIVAPDRPFERTEAG